MVERALDDLVRAEQTITAGAELFDLCPTRISPACQVGEHPLPQGLCVGDQLPPVRLRGFDLGHRCGLGALAVADRLGHGIGAHGRRLLCGLVDLPLGLGLGPRHDRRRGLPSRREHAGRLLAQQRGEPVLVELYVRGGPLLRVGELHVEPGQVLVDRADILGEGQEEGAHLVGVVSAESAGEGVAGYRVGVDVRRVRRLAATIRHCSQRRTRRASVGAIRCASRCHGDRLPV